MAAGILINSAGQRVIRSDGSRGIGNAGDPCCCDCYRQARLCFDDTLADVWMICSDAAMFPDAFSIGSACLYFNFADATSPTAGGMIYPAAAAVAQPSCAECPTPCFVADCSCENLKMSFHLKISLYDKSAGACGGILLSVCEGDGFVVSNNGGSGCIYSAASAHFPCPGFSDDPSTSFFQLIGAPPPCFWNAAFIYILGVDFQQIEVSSFVGTSPTTPPAFYPNVNTCFEFTANWVRVEITSITMICDDVP